MRIRIQLLKLMRIHADPDTDQDPKPLLCMSHIKRKFKIIKKLKGRLRAHNKRVKDGDALQLGDLTGIFDILLMGISASSLAFVVEIIRHHHTNKNSDRVVALTNINTNNAATDIM